MVYDYSHNKDTCLYGLDSSYYGYSYFDSDMVVDITRKLLGHNFILLVLCSFLCGIVVVN